MTVRVGDPELVLDPYDYDFHEDPYPYYRRLRDEAPLYRNEERNFWAVSRHHDVLQGFRDSTALSNAYGVSLDPSSRTSEAYRVMSMLAMDDPAHLRMRTLVSKGFTPRRIRELEPQVLELARIHLDSALQTESFDFVAEFAGKLPMDVISELIGVPDTDRARNGRIHAITELVEGQNPSTKSARAFLASLTERKQVLVVIGRSDEAGAKSVRNLPGVHILAPDQLNTYDVLRADDVVFSVEALNAYIAANTTTSEEVSA